MAVRDQAEYGRLAAHLSLEDRTRYLALESRLAALGATIEQAVEFWEQTHRPTALKPIGEAVDDCLGAKQAANKRPRYLEQLRYSLRSLAAAVGEETPCSSVTVEHLDKWLANPKWGPRHRFGKLTDARTLFSFCRRRKWVVTNPAEDVEPILVDAKRPGILTVEQTKRLFTTCTKIEPRLMPWLVLGIFCGVRPDEIKRLSWSHVDLKRALVDIPPEISKVRRRARFIPLQPNALAWIQIAPPGDLPPLNWRRRWQRVREKAGFRIRKTGKGEPWPQDAMRHTFCSYAMPIFGASKTAEWHGDDEHTMIAALTHVPKV